MVDFKKHLAKTPAKAPVNPLELYETLDRASDKGPLRPAQSSVLQEWHDNRRNERDIIVKLHTGQGKTLIGLLMLQSKLNEGIGPALYLCPNTFLVNQTAMQAKQFGLKIVLADPDLPSKFLDENAILVTTVHKLFNGLTKFGLGPSSIPLGSVVMDDSHACIDAIKSACMIVLPHDVQPYADLLNLFGPELEKQGTGKYADIRNGKAEAFLAVPYWDWLDKYNEIAAILSKYGSLDEIKYSWPILRDIIRDCFCVISGDHLEIAPYAPPLHAFGSYAKAKHRVFMSATVTNDAFLVKGLGLGEDTITNPLVYRHESWSGEKMILVPSLIHDSLTREAMVSHFGKSVQNRKYGVVALVPSSYRTGDWSKYGSSVATKKTIDLDIQRLRNGKCENPLVIVNRYDGIDLPDDSCRILVFDSRPHSQDLIDSYVESCREASDIIATRLARIVEQGLGRSVRGEKDYCAFVLIGPSLIRALRSSRDRAFFSSQTRQQIEIGLQIAEYAKEEIKGGTDPHVALMTLVNQCLRREEGWKEYYISEMNKLPSTVEEPKMLGVFAAEMEAENRYQAGDYDGAVAVIQKLIDTHINDESDKGWYLQEMARYKYLQSRAESNQLQVAAHSTNRYLLRPKHGMQFKKVAVVAQKRVANILGWLSSFANYEEVVLAVDEITTNARFGVKADTFEYSFDKLALILGFEGQRPDEEWKEGPDNLWAIRDNEYLLIECKSQVDLRRLEINKEETGQMNNSIAWFRKHYAESKLQAVMVINTKKVSKAAGFNEQVEVLRDSGLRRFLSNVTSFYREFKNYDLRDLSEAKVNEWLLQHHLATDQILKHYTEITQSL